jgi:hypothetical protein
VLQGFPGNDKTHKRKTPSGKPFEMGVRLIFGKRPAHEGNFAGIFQGQGGKARARSARRLFRASPQIAAPQEQNPSFVINDIRAVYPHIFPFCRL